MANTRVVVVANKWYECDPLIATLLPTEGSLNLPWPKILSFPHQQYTDQNRPSTINPAPRVSFTFNQTSGSTTNSVNVEVWCISDLIEDQPLKYQSSTETKASRMDAIFRGDPVQLTIGFGTAGDPTGQIPNGSVVIGTAAFLRDGHPAGQATANPLSGWHTGPFGQVIASSLKPAGFSTMVPATGSSTTALLTRLLSAPLPLAPVAAPTIVAGYDLTCLSTVNVTDPSEYAAADQATVNAFATASTPTLAGSVDTTLGLIRAFSPGAFIFVAGIVNRLGKAGTELLPRKNAQDHVGSHNAGIVVADMLPRIASWLVAP